VNIDELKRYYPYPHHELGVGFEEDDDGDWVSHEDVAPLLAELEAPRALRDALPTCDGPEDFDEDHPEECGAVATWRTVFGDALEHYCDRHVSVTTGEHKVELPYAEQLRALEKVGQ
jgi:hypothetical protein